MALRQRFTIFFFLSAMILGGCQISLAGDIVPPAGSELGQATPTPEPLAYPAAAPDADFGQLIFAQSCAPCHGDRGLGDGDQTAALPVAVPSIGDSELAQSSSPESWYAMVSQGNLDNYMPPFAGSLSVQDRWDVLAYVYSLSQDQNQLQAGQQIAAEQALEPGDLETLGSFSQAELGAGLAADLGLSEADGIALAAYLQASALGLALPASAAELDAAAEPTAVEEATPPSEAEEAAPTPAAETSSAIILQGQVSNGSGGDVPTGAEVLLRGFDQGSEVFSESTELDSGGRYRFEQTALDPTWVYAVTIDYEGLIYFSETIVPDGAQTDYDLPLTVYDTTSEISNLAIESLQLVMDYSVEGMVRVVQLIAISNSGDLAVVPRSDEEPVIFYGLPPEASNLAFQSGSVGDRYILTEDGFGDLRAVLPGSGEYQMLYAYELPFNRGLDFEQPLFLPVNQVTVFTLASHTELTSSDFIFLGNQQLDNEIYAGYHAQQNYAAGDTLRFEISGEHPLGASNALRNLVGRSDFLVGLIALAMVVAVVWLWLRRQNAQQPDPEEIMDAIIALDARYAEDNISDDAYLKRRAALKERLRRALPAKGAKAR